MLRSQPWLVKNLHVTVEFGPALCYGLVIFFTNHQCGLLVSTSIAVMCLVWAYFSMVVLHKIGLVRLIFGMEYAAGWDRVITLAQPGHDRDPDPLVLFCMQMDSPDDMGKFQKRMDAHFSQYYRCAYNVVRVRGSVFFRTVTDEMLRKRIIVHEQALDHAQFQAFVAS